MEIINTELILADLEIVENRIGKIEKKAETTKDKLIVLELGALKKAQSTLLENKPLRSIEYTKDELEIIKPFNFITLKKIIYVANVSDEEVANGNSYTNEVIEYARCENAEVVIMSAKLESELSDLEGEDKMLFLSELGIEESGLDLLIKATYSLLGLKTFFTSGKDEVRAWTFKSGMKAPVQELFILILKEDLLKPKLCLLMF